MRPVVGRQRTAETDGDYMFYKRFRPFESGSLFRARWVCAGSQGWNLRAELYSPFGTMLAPFFDIRNFPR
jgi:hypothetical protein